MKTKADYLLFLKSDHWRQLRSRVLERDGFRCTRCPARARLQAHHTIYRDRWEDSQPDDLITLCRNCHRIQHGLPPDPPRKRKSKSEAIAEILANRKRHRRQQSQPRIPKRIIPPFNQKRKRRPMTDKEKRQYAKYAPVMIKHGPWY